jgi:septal ring factor EnvC (AmiA/AmiB activator)
MMASILICALLFAAPQVSRPVSQRSERPPQSEPLTQAQITKLQQTVRRTQDRNIKLKKDLAERQQQLMKEYAQFKLDDARIAKLHIEVIDLQRGLLENYRDLQVALREIVGEQRFAQLKMRIDLILKSNQKVHVPKTDKQKTDRKGSGGTQPMPRSNPRL